MSEITEGNIIITTNYHEMLMDIFYGKNLTTTHELETEEKTRKEFYLKR